MNYQEWKKENPRKSINEYYIEFPEKKTQPAPSYPPPPVEVVTPPIIVSTKKTKPARSFDLVLIFASILIIVAFFLPWVNVKILSLDLVNSSGPD